MSSEGAILSAIDGPVATLTFHNPERHNAMSLDMWRAAADVFAGLAADPAVRVIVLTGAGEKAFVSGADISRFSLERASAESVAIYNAAVDHFSDLLLDCQKPCIAMIRGYCIGGGIGIATCCDLRISDETARFGVPAAKLGLGYGTHNLRRLARLIGPQFAAEMLYTARQFDAAEAVRIGLVNRVAPDAVLERTVREIAATIAGNAPLTIRAVKAVLRDPPRNPEELDALVRQCFESEDYQEGRRAFLEKRKPVFTGK
jgi:enoyl-CoA hydratase/carnithine racemase